MAQIGPAVVAGGIRIVRVTPGRCQSIRCGRIAVWIARVQTARCHMHALDAVVHLIHGRIVVVEVVVALTRALLVSAISAAVATVVRVEWTGIVAISLAIAVHFTMIQAFQLVLLTVFGE